jgi:hypothetical protein
MRNRLKVLETVAAEAALHPILPASARAAIAELVALNRELVEAVESLQRLHDENIDLRAELAEASYGDQL